MTKKKTESDVLTKTFFVEEIQKVYGAVALNRKEFTEQIENIFPNHYPI